MAAVAAPALAPVIPITRRRGRPSRQDEACLELAMRGSEERAMSVRVLPAMRRLEMVVRDHGPEAWHQWAVVAHELGRHRARWTDDEGRVA